MRNKKIHSLIAIGLGPSNLSLAALLYPIKDYNTLFLEKNKKFSWHPYMLFGFSKINVDYYKDLVSLVDPTNPFSFMNYLVKNKKQYLFINSALERISRYEFQKYYQWAADSMQNLQFDQNVKFITFDEKKDLFMVTTHKDIFFTKKIVIGTGIKAKLPANVKEKQNDDTIFHCYEYLKKSRNFKGKNVLIVGGGQSGAEILYSLLENTNKLPQKIYWVSTKGYPVVLDETPFANAIYTPTFSELFYNCSLPNREKLNSVLKDTSDGIHESLMNKIYQRLLELKTIENQTIELIFIPMTKLKKLSKYALNPKIEKYCATIQGLLSQNLDHLDAVIFCTGYTYNADNFMPGLTNYYGEKLEINKDFSVKSIFKQSTCKLYLNNGAKTFYGPADPNLSLISWRNSIIINSMYERTVYNVSNYEAVLSWGLNENVNLPFTKNALEAANAH